jgi:thiol-disulfide isomerase/thioredoxin
MSKATRIRQQNAREKIKAQQAAARRAEVRKRTLIVAASIVVVLAIVVAFVAIGLNHNNSSGNASGSTTGTVLPASVHTDITTVPASALDKVGIGSVPSYMAASQGGAPPIEAISDKALTSNGKPEMLYIGAEFCPYCAAMRWSMAVALSRFGTFTTPLHGIHSSSTDTDPNTPTLTFYKSSYSSPYLTFTPVENETISRGPLQNPTAAQQALWVKYDSTANGVGYPFIDFGNKYVIKTPIYDPAVLAGMTWEQVAADLHNPSSPVAQGALGAANLMTAAICKMTGGQPGNVCTSSAVVSMNAHL